jgi:hypothetical protein
MEARVLRKLMHLLGNPPSAANVAGEFWSEYATELNRILTMSLQGTLLGELQRYVDLHQPAPAWDLLVHDGNQWSMETITRISKEISDNSRGIVDETVRDAVESGLSTDELMERLAWRFGPVHAEMVAITELTRANAQAAIILKERLVEMGVGAIRRWLTEEDEKVCEICGPLDHATDEEDGSFHGGGITMDTAPAHPKCRCDVAVEKI